MKECSERENVPGGQCSHSMPLSKRPGAQGRGVSGVDRDVERFCACACDGDWTRVSVSVRMSKVMMRVEREDGCGCGGECEIDDDDDKCMTSGMMGVVGLTRWRAGREGREALPDGFVDGSRAAGGVVGAGDVCGCSRYGRDGLRCRIWWWWW